MNKLWFNLYENQGLDKFGFGKKADDYTIQDVQRELNMLKHLQLNAQNLNKTADHSAKDLSFDDMIDMGNNTCSKLVEN